MPYIEIYCSIERLDTTGVLAYTEGRGIINIILRNEKPSLTHSDNFFIFWDMFATDSAYMCIAGPFCPFLPLHPSRSCCPLERNRAPGHRYQLIASSLSCPVYTQLLFEELSSHCNGGSFKVRVALQRWFYCCYHPCQH